MLGLGIKEIVIIAFVIVLLFGSKKIPELTQSIAEAVKNLMGIFNGTEGESNNTKKGSK